MTIPELIQKDNVKRPTHLPRGKVTIEDLIRKDGHEPGGYYPSKRKVSPTAA